MRILLAVIAVACCITCSAQRYLDDEQKVFSGGMVLGMNFSQIDGDTYFGYHKIGLNTGGVVYVHFNKTVGVTLELLYSQKGSRGEDVLESGGSGAYVTKYFMNVNYMEVPFTLHVISHKFDFEGGLSYGLLVGSKEWILADHPMVIDPDKNRFNTSDLDYVFGLGHQLYKKLYANARFQYSITSIRPPDRIPVGYGYGNMGQFNNLFSLRLMYWF